MTTTWNFDIPATANQILEDVPDIEENFQLIKDIMEAITNGTFGTTDSANYLVDALAASVAVTTLTSKDSSGMDFQDDGANSAMSIADGGQLTIKLPGPEFMGCILNRSKFTYSSTTAITMDSAVYHHKGTKEQFVYWNSQLSFSFSGVGTSEWQYVYIDDSAIVTAGTNLLTASEFVHNTTAPTYSQANHGWYNGSDRCIFAVYIDGSGNVTEFFHDGDFVQYADSIENLAATDIDTTWTDVTLTIPGFSTKAQIEHEIVASASSDIRGSCRVNGQTGTGGFTSCAAEASGVGSGISSPITDSSQIIEIKHDQSDTSTSAVNTLGFYLPIGM